MKLRRRILNTTAWNLAIILGPPVLYNSTQAVVMWGALRGYWPLYVTM